MFVHDMALWPGTTEHFTVCFDWCKLKIDECLSNSIKFYIHFICFKHSVVEQILWLLANIYNGHNNVIGGMNMLCIN